MTISKELNKHKEIKISIPDKIKLFLSLHGKVMPTVFFKKKAAFQKLYNEGKQKIEKMLDLFKIIKDNRKFKIILKNSLMS
jgi:hypothetical protein